VTNHRLACRLSLFAALLAWGTHAHAQATPPPFDVAVSSLAARIAQPLEKAGAKKVVVAELQGPDGQVHPVGKYLADRLSDALQKGFPLLEVISGSPQQPTTSNPNSNGNSGNTAEALGKMNDWARGLGANFVIFGSFAKAPQGIGVSLSATRAKGSWLPLGYANALIPVTEAIIALSPDPIPSPKNGIFKAGTGGTTVPSCIHCPPPDYTDKARAAKYQGTVVLELVVNADGRAEHIEVVQGPGLGLDAKAIDAVKKWKFNPALGPDAKPVIVKLQIEIAFRLMK
jgi:TonB family protein